MPANGNQIRRQQKNVGRFKYIRFYSFCSKKYVECCNEYNDCEKSLQRSFLSESNKYRTNALCCLSKELMMEYQTNKIQGTVCVCANVNTKKSNWNSLYSKKFAIQNFESLSLLTFWLEVVQLPVVLYIMMIFSVSIRRMGPPAKLLLLVLPATLATQVCGVHSHLTSQPGYPASLATQVYRVHSHLTSQPGYTGVSRVHSHLTSQPDYTGK
jgi:hypothetical protein